MGWSRKQNYSRGNSITTLTCRKFAVMSKGQESGFGLAKKYSPQQLSSATKLLLDVTWNLHF
ncbi:hypothetical protein IGI04_029628 [Brassica rapa subsp. trilocularis]|uniref:Uncharacterized protein n=1 Tax=Brassica rapa subsp. trilocularis TaxID=1813537 RepID=A0ABQ7LNH1_BRACM|nr:hypothetical protein IGI04_029628 [Brassica rapa subsp. trilocularis]